MAAPTRPCLDSGTAHRHSDARRRDGLKNHRVERNRHGEGTDISYFTQLDDATFRPTEHVGGAWNPREQHIAPALGLMLHLVETDRDQRRDDLLVVSRLCYDILGVVAMDDVDVTVKVMRPGRTIELVEAVLSQGHRPAVVLRAWLAQGHDTAALEGSELSPIPVPDQTPAWDPTSVWPGGFIASVEVRRTQARPGRAHFWVRTDVPLLDLPTTRTSSAVGLFDIANGMAVRAGPQELSFPNLDLTAHLFREPAAGWLGFDTTVSFGSAGQGVTSTVLHDEHGPLGTMSQALTLRPARGPD